MKKIIFVLLPLLLLYSSVAYAAGNEEGISENNISVTINGIPVEFSGQGPVIYNGRTLVPVRGVFEQLGFDVHWDSTNREVRLTSGTTHVLKFFIGGETFRQQDFFNRALDVPAQIINDTTMLPIRPILEAVGYVVYWDSAQRTVAITTPSIAMADAFTVTLTVENNTLPQGENFRTHVRLQNISGYPIEIGYEFLFQPLIYQWTPITNRPSPSFLPFFMMLAPGEILENIIAGQRGVPALMNPAQNIEPWLLGENLEPGMHELQFRATFWAGGEFLTLFSNTVILYIE